MKTMHKWLMHAMMACILLGLAVVGSTHTTKAATLQATPPYATVCEHINFGGRCVKLAVGTYDGTALARKGMRSNISSLYLWNADSRTRTKVTLYGHPGCYAPVAGPFTGDVRNLGQYNFNDKAQCVVVQAR